MTEDRAERVAELTDRYGRMVFATAYRVLGNTHDAEDALQDVFLKLLHTWNGHLKPGAVRDWGAYLRVMTTRRAVDLLRRTSRRGGERDELSGDIEAPANQSTREVVSQRQEATLLRQALRSLPKRDAQIFALRYFEECAYEEIAQEMGLSVSQVGVILHRGRKRLREILEPVLQKEKSHVEP